MSSYKDRGLLRTASHFCDGTFGGKIEDVFLAVKSSTVLPQYKLLYNWRKNLFNNYQRLYLTLNRETSRQRKELLRSNARFLLDNFSRFLLTSVKCIWFLVCHFTKTEALRTLSYFCDETFLGKAKKFHITLEKWNVLKISVKKKKNFIIERKSYVEPFHKIWIRTETTKIFIFVAISQKSKQNKLRHFRH